MKLTIIRKPPEIFVNPTNTQAPSYNVRQSAKGALAAWWSNRMDYSLFEALRFVLPLELPSWPDSQIWVGDPGFGTVQASQLSREALGGILGRIATIPEGTRLAFVAGLIDEVEVA